MSDSEADLVESAAEVAVILTANLADTGLGAEYVVEVRAVLESVPQEETEQLTLQVTPLFEASFATVAAKPTDWP